MTVLTPGQVLIDRYEVISYLNQGGMQEVYHCVDRTLRREAVIKTPRPEIKNKRFKRGAEMGARINHHNIAATFDYYESDAITFLVEEYVDGIDLGHRLQQDFYYLDPALAAHVIHNICRALHEAHRAGICHRDLKPSNIMTSPDYGLKHIKLTDFGIAKLAENEIKSEMDEFERDPSTLTTANTLLGAIPYMAPECWTNWRQAGQPIDVWALGCIAYQLVTGNPPFGNGRAAIRGVALAEQNGTVNLAPPALFGKNPANSEIESEIWRLINSCLQIKADDRPKAAELLEHCGSWLYAHRERRIGEVRTFGVGYAAGGKSKTGEIADAATDQAYFYHVSEFHADRPPQIGERVSVSVYPGNPRPRAAPVLPLR